MLERIKILRELMLSKGYDYYIVPSTDDHNNEYVPDCWQYRAWITGFTGSAGDALIGTEKAFLSTDSRYFIQAENQLDSNIFDLIKQQGFASGIDDYLINNAANKTIAIDPKKISIAKALKLKTDLEKIGAKIVFDNDNLIEETMSKLNIKIDVPVAKVFTHDIQYSGQSTKSKLQSIRNFLRDNNQNAIVESRLDAIMWALNIRGSDVKCSPFAISYLVITDKQAYFYIDNNKLDQNVIDTLKEANITIKHYQEFFSDLSNYESNYILDDSNTNYYIYQQISQNDKSTIVLKQSPITLSKAIKNTIEISGSQSAHKKDAVAFMKWWNWLENNYQDLDELSAQKQLFDFRSEQKGFVDNSFDSITGFGSNGAIVHYRSADDTNKKFDDKSPLLTDSGGQYKDGTTDVTRVLHFGEPTFEQKRYYTLVLKGHIAIARAVFPKGVTGSHLDILARQFLWKFCANYGHGTGHGVGSFLSVHEGPQSITPNSKQELMPGMILSNEPGVYFTNNFGIRVENLCYIRTKNQESPTGDGPFYCFENLTLIPYEYKMIETKMLTYMEKRYINNYYSRIRKEILPMIADKSIKEFIENKTRHIR